MTCLEGERHNLEDGNFVQFAEVEGMDGLSEDGPFEVKVVCACLTYTLILDL